MSSPVIQPTARKSQFDRVTASTELMFWTKDAIVASGLTINATQTADESDAENSIFVLSFQITVGRRKGTKRCATCRGSQKTG
jgi:hypothetical protein